MDNRKKVYFYLKPFIDFPNTNAKYVKEEFIFKNEENIFLYQLLGKKLPFKCLKPWNKKELAINTDGDLLPCCLLFNNNKKIGNIFDGNLVNILNSNDYKEFRKKIFLEKKQMNYAINVKLVIKKCFMQLLIITLLMN